MSPNFGPMLLILVALVVVVMVLAWLAVALIRRQPRRTAEPAAPPTDETPEDQPWPYSQAASLLSPAEMDFYRVLVPAVRGALLVCPKVGLGDVFQVDSGSSGFQSWRNKISQKHVDFLLCDPASIKPVLGIELDDASHRNRRDDDEVKDRVFAAAGLPLLRQPVQATYDAAQLVADIRALFEKP